jgi:hypothetical protein
MPSTSTWRIRSNCEHLKKNCHPERNIPIRNADGNVESKDPYLWWTLVGQLGRGLFDYTLPRKRGKTPFKMTESSFMPKDHKYWVYIVTSLTGTLYIGMTNSIERRIAEHKTELSRALLVRMAAIAWSTGRASTMFAKQSTGKSS